jgi:hypothetical protein
MNPFLNALHETECNYQIKSPMAETHTICHLLYMDDLKVYAWTPRQLNELIKVVELFHNRHKNEVRSAPMLDINIRYGKVALKGFKTCQDIIHTTNETDT